MSANPSLVQQPPVYFEITLVESNGPLFGVGQPRLFYWLKSFHLPGGGTHDARACLLIHSPQTGAWTEHRQEVSAEQSEVIAHYFQRLGLPGRALDVEAVVDTSDSWTNLSFRLRMEGEAFALDMDMLSSGFRGKDANDLKALFRSLFALVGHREQQSVVYD